MAKHVLALSDSQLSVLMDNSWLEEVKNDGEKISE